MKLRIRYEVHGPHHVRARFFSGPSGKGALHGSLIFRGDEWVDFVVLMQKLGREVELLHDDGQTRAPQTEEPRQ